MWKERRKFHLAWIGYVCELCGTLDEGRKRTIYTTHFTPFTSIKWSKLLLDGWSRWPNCYNKWRAKRVGPSGRFDCIAYITMANSCRVNWTGGCAYIVDHKAIKKSVIPMKKKIQRQGIKTMKWTRDNFTRVFSCMYVT